VRRSFPARPPSPSGHVTDQAFQDKRQRSTEIELSTPLWLPGEGTATRASAQAGLARLDAEIAAARLAVAGEVREAAYALALAERQSAIAERRADNARTLERDIARRVRAGESSQLDLDLARGDRLDAEANAQAERASVAAARAALLSLTGRPPPADFEEPLVTAEIEQHPRLQAALRAVDAARADLRLTEMSDRDSPEIGIVAGRNRDVRGDEYDSTIGVRLRIPFATEGRNAPRRAAAQAGVSAALAQYAAAQREVRLDVDTSRAALATAEEQSKLLDDRLRAVRDSVTRLERSFAAGQIAMVEVLRGRAALFEAELAQARNSMAVLRARARLNQALGVVP
jgi:outer membrane protein TolC